MPRFWNSSHKRIDTTLGMCIETPHGRIRKADDGRDPSEPRNMSLKTLILQPFAYGNAMSCSGGKCALAPSIPHPHRSCA